MAEIPRCHVRQRPDAAETLRAEHFDIEYWRNRPGFHELSSGRGGSVRITLADGDAVLRRYFRGGWTSRVLADRYLWLGKQRSRPWREWDVLELALGNGLPVPRPLGACVCRHGLWYRAALMTAYLADTETLTQRLERRKLPAKDWRRLGALVRQMQVIGIRHADLTSDNVLIDPRQRFYLVDFDKARVMPRLDDWQWGPLYRFQRSMLKRGQTRKLNFIDDDWQALMDGYES